MIKDLNKNDDVDPDDLDREELESATPLRFQEFLDQIIFAAFLEIRQFDFTTFWDQLISQFFSSN